MAEIENFDELEKWLVKQRHEVCAVVVVRAFLRSFPAVSDTVAKDPAQRSSQLIQKRLKDFQTSWFTISLLIYRDRIIDPNLMQNFQYKIFAKYDIINEDVPSDVVQLATSDSIPSTNNPNEEIVVEINEFFLREAKKSAQEAENSCSGLGQLLLHTLNKDIRLAKSLENVNKLMQQQLWPNAISPHLGRRLISSQS